VPKHLDAIDARGVDQESPLYPDAVRGHSAHGEVLVDAAGAAADHYALEHLDTLAVPFDYAGMNPNGVPGAELRDVVLELLGFDRANELCNHCQIASIVV
jgi:hypothetical protein